MTAFASRRNRLRKLVEQAEADALLVTNFKNVTYLTGFTGDDSYLLVTLERRNARSATRATRRSSKKSARACSSRFAARAIEMLPRHRSVVERAKIERLGIEGNSATVSLRAIAGQGAAERRARRHRQPGRAAADRQGQGRDRGRRGVACRQARAGVRRGAGELDAGDDRARSGGRARIPGPAVRRQGAELSGDRGRGRRARRCRTPRRPIAESATSDFVLVDWGANSGLYMSDLTRIIVTGKISPKLVRYMELC